MLRIHRHCTLAMVAIKLGSHSQTRLLGGDHRPIIPLTMAPPRLAFDPPPFDVRQWWYDNEHKESEIADTIAAHPEAGEFLALIRRLRSGREAPTGTPAGHDGAPPPAVMPPPPPLTPPPPLLTPPPPQLRPMNASIRVQRQAVRRHSPTTLLSATRYDPSIAVHSLGGMTERCIECQAMMWIEERKPGSSQRNPMFELCCKGGKIRLQPFPNPPRQMMQLLEGDSPQARHYRENLRVINFAFGFTSSGANFDRSLADSRAGVYTYRIQGSVYHLISRGLLPGEGEEPGFAQIYIYDTDYQLSRRSAIFPHLDRSVLTIVQQTIRQCNPYVIQFMSNDEATVRDAPTQTFEIIVGERPQVNRQYDEPTGSEVAVLMLGDEDNGDGHRSIVLRKHDGGLQFVSQLDCNYDPLHFVLLFPFGNQGWSLSLKTRAGVTMNQFYCYHLMVREASKVLQLSGRLTQEYVVDAYAKIEESRLMWIRHNQAQLRANLYQGLLDQVSGLDAAPAGRMVILPPSFTGGPRYMQSLYQDAMAIVRKMGKPDLFITMTCNPKWKEITEALLPGQKASDRFDLCCRVFRLKLKALLALIIDKKVFGAVKGRVHVVEFQKRGLPHAHMLFILHDEFKPKTPDDIDQIVCAELPSIDDQELFDCIASNMMHGPCGAQKADAPCMKDGSCSKKYPKTFVEATQLNSDGYPLYRRRDDGRTVIKGRHVLDNRSVVPYNPYLCKVFGCHINVEICSSIHSVKYLYKYVYKGHDRIEARVAAVNADATSRDEPQRYVDARYVSASEAFWRICEFQLQRMYPSVLGLQIHDENMQAVVHREGESVDLLIERHSRTTLTEWMRYNREHPEDDVARQTLYCDFPSSYTWNRNRRTWTPRQTMQCIGRVHFVTPRDTTRYFLRLLLHHVPGATSYEDLRTVDGVVYATYQLAAQARGLLESDEEFDNDLGLAAGTASPRQVRELFAMMLLFCEVSDPAALLDNYFQDMAEDFMHQRGESELTDHVRQDVLSAIESILFHNGSTLANFPSLPQNIELPSTDSEWGDTQSLDVVQAIIEAEGLRNMLNNDQRALFNAVVEAVDAPACSNGKFFFVDGPGGSGKTFLYSALIAHLKSSKRHVLATATSGIAALLLEGGRTMHSTFKIPIPITHNSTCSFGPDTKVGRQIQSASLIIVDEAPMMHRHVYEALDRSFRDVMKRVDPALEHLLFGGKTVVLGGDFRQMLPVIPKGSRSAVVNATLNRSALWRSIRVFKLTANVRLAAGQQAWSEYLLSVGEGRTPSEVELPQDVRRVATLSELINSVYGQLTTDMVALTNRTILTPLNEDVVRVNDLVLDVFPGEIMEYRSADIIPPGEIDNASLYPTEFLNTIDDATMPLHKLRLKIGCTIILLRNLSTTRGLCNGTRLRVQAFFPTMLQVRVISQGAFYGDVHLLPRIALYPSQSRLPFRFKRLQFPVRLAFAMTINKAQGQTLDMVGFYLPNQLFTHGQLYVTLSRTRTGPTGIVFCDGGSNRTAVNNVVYTEVLQ